MSDIADILLEHRRRIAAANLAKIEEMCEKSITDPKGRGVFVVEDRYGNIISAELRSSVPFGTVHVMTREIGNVGS